MLLSEELSPSLRSSPSFDIQLFEDLVNFFFFLISRSFGRSRPLLRSREELRPESRSWLLPRELSRESLRSLGCLSCLRPRDESSSSRQSCFFFLFASHASFASLFQQSLTRWPTFLQARHALVSTTALPILFLPLPRPELCFFACAFFRLPGSAE